MKILITNFSLAHYTGTESWVYAMAKELKKENEVVVWTLNKGLMSNKLEKLGVGVMTTCPTSYDIAIVNHNVFWNKVKEPKVFTSHSKIFEIERPPIQDYIGVNEYIGGTVIRNGVDLERFKPTQINKKLKNILLLSNPEYAKGKEFVKDALKEFNIIIIDHQTFEIENYINQADLVISFQRGAIESLASGKNVIYADWRNDRQTFEGYGIINEDSYELFKTGQMREKIRPIPKEELREMVNQYNPELNLRSKIEEDFDIKKTAKQYLWILSKKNI